MKTLISVNSSPYLTKPLRSIEQVQADQEAKKHRLEAERIAYRERSSSKLKQNSH